MNNKICGKVSSVQSDAKRIEFPNAAKYLQVQEKLRIILLLLTNLFPPFHNNFREFFNFLLIINCSSDA